MSYFRSIKSKRCIMLLLKLLKRSDLIDDKKKKKPELNQALSVITSYRPPPPTKTFLYCFSAPYGPIIVPFLDLLVWTPQTSGILI